MELEQLRVFVAVAQTRTFVEAAARLNKSQPAVTMTVKALEREMGVPLFEREGRGKRLTAAGARLAAKAAGILEGARRLKEDVAGEPEVPRGPVRVGAGEGGLGFARRTRPWLSRCETSATWSRSISCSRASWTSRFGPGRRCRTV